MTIELIAELSGCHGGSLDNAIKLIAAAKNAGATGVKFQAFDPDRLAARRVKHPRLKAITWPGKPANYDDVLVEPALVNLYYDIHTPQEWFPKLITEATYRGLTWHASVFDPEDVAFLETLDCPRYKVASFEATDRDILDAILRTHKPLIVSANQNEDVRPPIGNVTVLHATNYGVAAKDANLVRIRRWSRDKARFTGHWPWGLSDHTVSQGPIAGMIAVALGACMIEWHIKLPDVSTPDDAFAWTPAEFARRVMLVREAEEAMNG